ncbi:DUF4249 domain-containing protein [Winogradskyella immobilis]|uniref:DUF4249 domain-containing protein n=1 Tax=Winogradskyella immobilis TaxID=2816852 RepID=A0ABS8ER39_9FLAO|nr:DUF4249 domain-containing protein [Winogradskyella immobilis]MCC1484767.1 DUF4249 domain-containing protein [Winogradskyella immobilis]MCG0016859.1 DUF4249 domain-containing protein [Winogradskyella immobilis]
MKKGILLLATFLLFTTCEDVIEIELNEAEPRLVIDASINWFRNTAGNEQSIKLSLTAPFFDDVVPPANGATVTITDTDGNTFNFIEEESTGIYRNSNFIPVIEAIYNLIIIYNEEIYTATETLKSVVPIERIEQKDDGGFLGDDIELKAFYTDPANIENFYFFEFFDPISQVPTLEVYDDRFNDGNEIFGFYSEEGLEQGDLVTIRSYGVSQRFFDFMFILLLQGSDDSGGPFETQPATIRGNCINQTNPDNFPFGYFRLSEADEVLYTIQ